MPWENRCHDSDGEELRGASNEKFTNTFNIHKVLHTQFCMKIENPARFSVF